MSIQPQYILPMAKNTKGKTENMMVRLQPTEREAFDMAASLAGVSLSSWVRERLRLAAIRELEAAGRQIPFVPPMPMRGRNV